MKKDLSSFLADNLFMPPTTPSINSPKKNLPQVANNFLKPPANIATRITKAVLTQAKPAPSTKKIRPILGVVTKAIKETPDTYTLQISVGPKDKDYLAGQFLNIDPHQFAELSGMVAYLENEKGKKELVRAYSITSAPFEETVDITTRPEVYYPGDTKYPPLLSPLLASNALVGRQITFGGYVGAYILKPEQAAQTNEVLHLVAGSGIVPNFAILKDELVNEKNSHIFHTMLYTNKTFEDIIFYKQLEELSDKYKNRFKLIHLLTREDDCAKYGNNFFKGRISLDFVSRFIKDKQKVLVYACGAGITKWQRKKAQEENKIATPRFLESTGQIAKDLNIDKKRYKREIYG
ncbi:hypothetical protein JYT19_00720 [Sulfobacillus acidophilus]|uniref:FAD-binding FR-type domain-containing protein n=1 Tax=Sulfobacillus acidophilus TaxID=53633 RepID=A0ABS3AYS6_9FIRM|nr:hypothetical protein [Sulfobacillus acidophilus]